MLTHGSLASDDDDGLRGRDLTVLFQDDQLPSGGGNRRIALVNEFLATAWRRKWLPAPELDPDVIVAAARRTTGAMSSNIKLGWYDRLTFLLTALEQEASQTPLGRTIAYGQLAAAVANRFRAEELLRRYPEILDVPVEAPIMIVGQMRSGSTRVQRLLACDPRLTFTRFYESWNPVPRKPMRLLAGDRPLRAWLGLTCARLLNPSFDALHPTGVFQPDEEIGLHSLSIFGAAFEAQWRIPSFTSHIEAMNAQPVYREFKRYLQILAWLRGNRADRPWLLKVPQFTQDLGALLAVFPDARLIYLHRDPAAVVASSEALVHNQMRLQSDCVDQDWIRREWQRKVALRAERVSKARAHSNASSVDLDYEAMNRDWRAGVEQIYQMLGIPPTESVIAKMRRYIQRSQNLGHDRYKQQFPLRTLQVLR
jgi:hypothetical protein